MGGPQVSIIDFPTLLPMKKVPKLLVQPSACGYCYPWHHFAYTTAKRVPFGQYRMVGDWYWTYRGEAT